MVAAMLSQLAPRPVAARPAASQRCMRLVVRSSAQKPSPLQTAISTLRSLEIPAAKPAAMALIANLIMAVPAHAEAGKIFDFGLTLPIMVAEFLFLMVFLDKTWFGPVGRHLEARDEELRSKLASVRDDSGELKAMQEEAENVVAEARREAQAAIQEAKSSTQEAQNKKLAEVKARIDKELESALATLEKEKESALKDLDEQVNKLSGEILETVLPEGVELS